MTDVTLPLAEAERVAALPRFAPGTSIGRFRIVGELGAGGMGVVFEAYDPELARAVAIKVVTEDKKLIDEAQAMARLSHPNVVPVYEVGTIDGQLFFVMELVRGETLASWLEQPRSWREIVSAFLDAGAGLAAAHQAGLVHRDFKPNNVLVDHSGHICVSDFGLARAQYAVGSEPAGTPGYIAPEQRQGGVVDARSDEYAFGISLERALAKKSAPRAVRAAITRASSTDPDLRFATIDELLAVLRRSLETRRRSALIAATTLVVVAGGATVAVVGARSTTDNCESGIALIDSVWNDATASTLAQQFSAVRPGANIAFATTRRMLDGWAATWRLGRRAACHAEPAERPARIACLDDSLGELRAQLAAWSHPDAGVVDRVASAASELPDPMRCAHAPASSSTARALIARAAALEAAHRAGRAKSVASAAVALVADARASGDPQATAAALIAAGQIAHDLGDANAAHDELAQAAVAAGRAGDDTRLLEALRSEAVVAITLGRPLDGLGLLDAADAVAARTGALDVPGEAHDATIRGNAFLDAGKLGDAERVLEHAVTMLEPLAAKDPARDLELASALTLLGDAYYQGTELDKARPLFLRALAIDERELGPMHPDVGGVLGDLAELEGKADMLDDAEAHNERARALFVAAYGPDDYRVAQGMVERGYLLARRGKREEGAKVTEQARAILEHTWPPDDLGFVAIDTQLGAIAGCPAGIPHFERALGILESRHEIAETHGVILGQYATCLVAAKRADEAYHAATKSVAELEKAGASPAQLALSWMTLADLEADRGHRARAIELADHLLATTDDHGTAALAYMRSHETAQLAVWKKP